MKENKEISERVTRIIESTGLSKNEFAKKLGYERAQTIYDIARGKSAPSYDFFYRFFNSEFAEGINHKYLFMSDDKMERVRSAVSGPYEKAQKVLRNNIVNEPSETYINVTDKDLAMENEYLKMKCENLESEISVLQKMLNNYKNR